MEAESFSVASAAPLRTPGNTLLMLIAVSVVIGIFLGLCHALGTVDYWAAFLFILYWGMFEHTDAKKLPHCIVGAMVGLLASYLLQVLPQVMGPSGGLVFLGVIFILIYGQLMGWLPVAINAMTMLFLTVGTSTALQAHTNFGSVLIALLLGIAYFGGLISLGKFIKQRATTAKVHE